MYIHNAEDSAEGSDSLVAKKFVYKYFLLKLVFHFHRKSPKHAVKLRMCEKYFAPCVYPCSLIIHSFALLAHGEIIKVSYLGGSQPPCDFLMPPF